MMAEAGSRVRTFSIGFGHPAYDETPHAVAVARHFDTDHHAFEVRRDVLDLLPMMARHVGEPFADSSFLPTYCVAKETSRHVTVALSGDGGDESLAGYDRYRAMALAAGVPQPLARAASGAARLLPNGADLRARTSRLRRFMCAVALPPSERYHVWTALFSSEQLDLLRGPFLDGDAPPPEAVGDDLDSLLRCDVEHYLPDDLLVKADSASMAASLELRSPFLDHELAAFCARLPANIKNNKACLRRAMNGRLPQQVLERPKMGFGVPIAQWLRGSGAASLADAVRSLIDRRVISVEYPIALIDAHASGKADHSAGLFALWALEEWYRAFIDR
jgi:asparagine synthase (glutamine-hydrolysing)